MKFFLTLENIYFFVEKHQIFIIFETNFDILPFNFVANWTKIEIIRKVMHDAIAAKSHMSNVSCRMCNKISNKHPFSFYFILYLYSGLFEDAPFWKMAFNYLNIVVFICIVNFYLHYAISSSLKSLMDHFRIVVILRASYLLNSFLDLELTHLKKDH